MMRLRCFVVFKKEVRIEVADLLLRMGKGERIAVADDPLMGLCTMNLSTGSCESYIVSEDDPTRLEVRMVKYFVPGKTVVLRVVPAASEQGDGPVLELGTYRFTVEDLTRKTIQSTLLFASREVVARLLWWLYDTGYVEDARCLSDAYLAFLRKMQQR